MLGSSEKVAAELKGSRLDFFPILFVAMRVMIMKTTTVATTAGSSDYCKTPYRMYFTRRQLCHRQLDEKKKITRKCYTFGSSHKHLNVYVIVFTYNVPQHVSHCLMFLSTRGIK